MKFTLFYDDSNTEDYVSRGYVVTEHIISFLTRMGHCVDVLGYHVLTTTLIKTVTRREQNFAKEIDLKLVDNLRQTDAIFYVSSENLKKDHFPNDMREALSLAMERYRLRRWNICGISCFVVISFDKSADVAKNIWHMFTHLELSMCMLSFQAPLLEERKDVKETALPTI